MGFAIIFVLAGAAAVAGIVVYVAKGSRKRSVTTAFGAGYAVVAFAAVSVAFTTLPVFYRIPPVWVVIVAALWIAVAVLFALTVRGIGRAWRRVVALLAVVPICVLMYGVLGMAGALESVGVFKALITVRAAQIGEANGFRTLLPKDMTPRADYMPVDVLPEDESVLAIDYRSLMVQERRAEDPPNESELLKLVEPGATPMGKERPPLIPSEVEVDTATIDGNAAVVASFLSTPQNVMEKEKVPMKATFLATWRDGVDIRIYSEAYEEWGPDRRSTPVPPRTPAELLEIARSMEPAR